MANAAQQDRHVDADAETLQRIAQFSAAQMPRKAAAIINVYGPKAATTTATVWRDAPEWAVRDAHAAFRAVPGLRDSNN